MFSGHSVPSVLQSTFHAQACEELFKHLCISGTPKIRLHAGLLLVQLCGSERWWGQFLSNVLQELYNSEQLLIFPQDRYSHHALHKMEHGLLDTSVCNYENNLKIPILHCLRRYYFYSVKPLS